MSSVNNRKMSIETYNLLDVNEINRYFMERISNNLENKNFKKRKFTSASGANYVGTIDEYFYPIKGKYTDKDYSLEGEFEKIQLKKGKYQNISGTTFNGDFENGKPLKGKIKFRSGKIFEGMDEKEVKDWWNIYEWYHI